MSDDLISRKALIREIEKNMNENNHTKTQSRIDHKVEHLHFMKMVSQQLTAYDVDKVIEKLERSKEEHEDECGFDEFEYIDYDSAIDIVKEGGV